MANLLAEPGQTIALSYYATDRNTGLYPKAFIYKTSGGTAITTVNLDHVANGYYLGEYTPDGTYEVLKVHIIPYTTAARTTPANYETTEDGIYVKYLWKPQALGFGETSAGITQKDIEQIVEKVKEGLKIEDILKELKKKSEFNPLQDIVKTDIKIPTTNLRDLISGLNDLKSFLKNKKDAIDHSGQLKIINENINEIKKGLKTDVQITGEFLKNIESQRKLLSNLREDVQSTERFSRAIKERINNLGIPNKEDLLKNFMGIQAQVQSSLKLFEKMIEALNIEGFERSKEIIDKIEKLKQSFAVLLMQKVTQGENMAEISSILELMDRNK